MFEMSLLESGGVLKTQSKRWAIAAFFINSSLLLTLILIPIFHPEVLPKQILSMQLIAPPPPPSAAVPVVREAAPTNIIRSVSELIGTHLQAPRLIPNHTPTINDDGSVPATSLYIPGSIGSGTGSDSAISSIFGNRVTPPPVVKQATLPKKPYAISGGVAEGRLISKTVPTYPAIALASRTQGTVVLAAIISKAGTIEKLHVISGPSLLQQAALNAVQSWRYQPYLLNGEPVEVETQINVIFNLGN